MRVKEKESAANKDGAETRKKTGMEIRPSLLTKLKMRSLERGVPMWRIVQDAIEQYLGVEPEQDPIPRHLWQYPEKFRQILASGHQLAITAVTKNVDAFLDLVELSARDRKGH